MAFEQDLMAKTQANESLTSQVLGKVAGIDAKMSTTGEQINQVVYDVREKSPYYRLSKNQRLTGTTGSVPDHWLSNSGCTYTLVQSVVDSTAWADRTNEERELLTAMGRAEQAYVYDEFHIWRLDWVMDENDANPFTLYQAVNGVNAVSVAAFTKILSGDIDGQWANGATNQWQLTGSHLGFTQHKYHHIHGYPKTPTGSVLLALPAAIAGYINFDPKTWGVFPYIGDGQND